LSQSLENDDWTGEDFSGILLKKVVCISFRIKREDLKEVSMVNKNAAWLVLFLFFFSIGKAWAHHPSGGAGISQAGPVRTISAVRCRRKMLHRLNL
jgi:hypothetical protein